MACVDLPALPLQLLLRRHPEWRRRPVAVVEDDNPLSPLLWINEAARRAGVLPGMRYAAGLSLDHRLCAGTVPANEIAQVVDQLQRLLLGFSPEVEAAYGEPGNGRSGGGGSGSGKSGNGGSGSGGSSNGEADDDEPGVFWLNATGLDRLHDSLASWAEQIQTTLRKHRFLANVTVGFTRFGSYTLVRVRRGVNVLSSFEAEQEASHQVPLARLGIDPRLRDDLAKLGIRSVGEFLQLPATGIQRRFGPRAARLLRLARGDLFDPLRPRIPPEPDRVRHFLDDPEHDAWRLLFLIKKLTHPLLARLADRQQGVAKLHLHLVLADRRRCHEELQPAAATLDMVLLMELVRLRLETLVLDAGVEIVTVEVDAVEAPPETLDLFRQHQRRNPQAALRALARIRAELGDSAVVRAVLRPGHLPEAGFRWTSVSELKFPEPRSVTDRPLIRRLLNRPVPLAGPLCDLLRERVDRRGLRVGRPPQKPQKPQKQKKQKSSRIQRAPGMPPGGHSPAGHSPAGSASDGCFPRCSPKCPPGGAARADQHRLPRLSRLPRLRILQPRARRLELCGSYALSGGWWRREVRRLYHFVETDRGELLWVYYDQYRRRWFLQGTVE